MNPASSFNENTYTFKMDVKEKVEEKRKINLPNFENGSHLKKLIKNSILA